MKIEFNEASLILLPLKALHVIYECISRLKECNIAVHQHQQQQWLNEFAINCLYIVHRLKATMVMVVLVVLVGIAGSSSEKLLKFYNLLFFLSTAVLVLGV